MALGITQAALSNYELGKRRLYHHQIESIAKILGKDLEYFIGSGTPSIQGAANGGTSLHDRIVSRMKTMSPEALLPFVNTSTLSFEKNPWVISSQNSTH